MRLCVGRENEIEEFQKIFERVRGGVAVTKFLNGEFGGWEILLPEAN